MKFVKSFLKLSQGAILLSLLASCSDFDSPQQEIIEPSDEYYSSVTMVVPPLELEEDEPQTKNSMVEDNGVVNYIWNATDTVGIFPQTGSQIYFSMKSGAGKVDATFDGGGWALKKSSSYFSYYPFIPDYFVDRSAIPVTFLGQKQVGSADPNRVDLGKYCYMVAKGVSDEKTGNLYFDYQRVSVLLRFTIPVPAGEYKALTLQTSSPLMAVNGTVNAELVSATIDQPKLADELTLNLSEANFAQNGNLIAFLMVPPFKYLGKQLDLVLTKTDGSVVKAAVLGRDFNPQTLYGHKVSFSVYPTEFEISNKGGKISINLLAQKATPYALESDVDWIDFDPSNATSGTAELKASLSQNTGKPRVGHIFITQDASRPGLPATLKNVITVRQTPDGFNAEIGGWGDGGEFGGEAE